MSKRGGGVAGVLRRNPTVIDVYWDEERMGVSRGPKGAGYNTSEMTGKSAERNMSGLNWGIISKLLNYIQN